ncbi:MAG: glycosyltransferase [Mucilaginibacter sp.]
MMEPLVSIALCTYDGEKFLAKQLDSILAQDYKNIEIIAVDDCSDDNTPQILKDYALKDKRLRVYVNDQNMGHTLNFEKAIKLCSGEFIALADQDDLWEKNKIKVLKGSIEGHVMVYHNSDFIDDQDNRIGDNTMATRHRMYEGESCLPVILANNIHGHAIFFKSDLRHYFLPWNNGLSHDWAIAYTAFNMGRVKYVPDVLVHYRQHQNSITDFLEQKHGTVRKKGLSRLPVTETWLQYCLLFNNKRDEQLVNKACLFFLDVMNGKNRPACFQFMLRHFDLLFYTMDYKKRSFISKLNFARKLCFA